MGTIINDLVVFVVADRDDIEEAVNDLRDSMQEPYRRLLVGPVPGVVNRYVTYAFLPDGSKEGWDESRWGDVYRHRFIAIFKDSDAYGMQARFGELSAGLHASLPFPEERS